MTREKLVILPTELTAENGAKGLLMGEFHEEIELNNPDWCGCSEAECIPCTTEDETYMQKVPVSWTTIKEIYKMVAKNSLMLRGLDK